MIAHEINAAIQDVVAAGSAYASLQAQEQALSADLNRVQAARADAERNYRKFQNELLRVVLDTK